METTIISKNGSGDDPGIWKIFLKRHWKMTVLFVIGAALAIFGAILVYLWFVGTAQVSGLVPASLGLWTMGYVVTFVLNLAFWELVLIGIPVVLACIGGYAWYEGLPTEEREGYRRGKRSGARSRRRDWGNGLSFLVTIAFIIKVNLDGNWNSPFSTWTLDYLVYSYIWALISILIIVGIPAAIGGTWWLRREIRRCP